MPNARPNLTVDSIGMCACAGHGFNAHKLTANRVTLGNTSCPVVSATTTQLVCSSEAWSDVSSQTVFPGGGGVQLDRWHLLNGQNVQLDEKLPEQSPDLATTLESLYVSHDAQRGSKHYVERMMTIFTPQVSGMMQYHVVHF